MQPTAQPTCEETQRLVRPFPSSRMSTLSITLASLRPNTTLRVPFSGPWISRSSSVLVVDDESDVSELIAEVLSRDGYQVTTAGSGIEALQQLSKSRFALMLSDLKMPDMDGRRLSEQVSADYPDIADRLGFITGDTMSPSARKFLDNSGRPFLEKPIKPAELRKLVAALLEQAG